MPVNNDLRLSAEQLDMVYRAGSALLPSRRDEFLLALAEALREKQNIGNGELYIEIRKIQREHWDPPLAEPRPSVVKADSD